MASSVLLTKQLKPRKQKWEVWLEFRDVLIDEELKEHGELFCRYCGKRNLVRESPFKDPDNLATIDHIKPLSKGGKRYDKSNCAIACLPCNKKKADNEWAIKIYQIPHR